MLKYYDVKCEKCNKISEQFVEEDFDPCEFCGGNVKRVYSSFNFKLIYNNKKDICGWSDSGYETSRYWDDVKKGRSEGKNVAPATER